MYWFPETAFNPACRHVLTYRYSRTHADKTENQRLHTHKSSAETHQGENTQHTMYTRMCWNWSKALSFRLIWIFINTPSRCRDLQVVTEEQLESFADSCRDHISNWIDKVSLTGRGHNATWREELIRMVVRHTVSRTAGWREVFQSAQQLLQQKYPNQANNIENTFKNYLKKSPVGSFLKEKAYQWLQYLQVNHPTTSDWYPHLAVEVAHKVFCLHDRLATFLKYLRHPSRRKTLTSIPIPVEGLSQYRPGTHEFSLAFGSTLLIAPILSQMIPALTAPPPHRYV